MRLHQDVSGNEREAEEGLVDGPIRMKNHKLSLTCLCIDSKNKHAFTASKDGSLIKWCLETKKILYKVNSISKKDYENDKSSQKRYHTRHINCIAISSDDKFLATGGWDKNIRVWSPKDLSWIHTFTLHRQEVTALTFRKGHATLYSGSADRSVMLWTLEDDDNRCFVEALYGHESTITSMDVLKKEKVLSSGGLDQSIRVWKIVEQAQTVFESKHQSVDIVRYIDDKTFVSGGEDGSICVWTTMKRKPICSLMQAHKPSRSIEMVGDTNSKQNGFWITALATFCLKEPRKFKGSKRRKHDASDEEEDRSEDDEDEEESEPEGTNYDDENKSIYALVASGSCDSMIRVWKLVKKGSECELLPHQSIECPGFINDIQFTSDCKKLIAAVGQEHKFGRWWKVKGSKNCMKVFDVDKV